MRRIVLTLALSGALALAAGALQPAPATATSPSTGDGGLMIVVDSSGSMAEPTTDGTSRMDAAQSALGVVIGELPDPNRVGLRVFGATELGSAASCSDSQLLVPIGTDNRDALRASVDALSPAGETPIGHALQQAGADLGDDGQRAILLVSDGIANCEPDPCVVAAELTANDIAMRIDVIGFDVDDAAREQLQCVADRGRGDYLDVSEASSLQHALERLSTRAFRPFDVVGEPIDGVAEAEGAPALVPGTQYVDELGGDVASLHYLVERTRPGSVIHVGLAGRLPHEGSLEVDASLSTLAGEPCDTTDIIALGDDRFSVFTGRLSAAEGSPQHPCATAEQLLLRLEVVTPPDSPVPFELRIAEHAWPSDAAQLPPPIDAERGWELSIPADGAAGAAVGGSSLNDAPLVEPGSYTTEMLPSEFQFFRVQADWGQSVRVHASLDPALPAPANAWGILQVLDPVGADVAALLATTADGTRWSQAMPEAGDAVAATTAPVRFDANPGLVRRAVLSGEHIVAVGFGADAGTTPSRLIVTIEVVGESQGAPDLSGTAPPPTDGEQAAGEAVQPGQTAVPWALIGVLVAIGAVLIAIIALVVWLWQRRSRRSFDV
ncbi:VWA domain-containing protein [Agrococcus sediminis]|uniref:VWA domain-containing protein n=1 Tax=Agrococcus sediminis TaxID=2599924 RepID=A0A5M8QAR4_9MICO|nr:VWA domain-containing protein [Agrococcus sediminis]KAA6433077.1 VWA domain-containing protein [Agrococcus sediminis]